MTTFQTIVCITPFVLFIATTIFPSLTQTIWIAKDYKLYFTFSLLYAIFGEWVMDFTFEKTAFVLIPTVYFSSCYLFDKIFQKIKPADLQRDFPVFTLSSDFGDDLWDEKSGGPPTSVDRRISFWTIMVSAGIFIIMAKVFN